MSEAKLFLLQRLSAMVLAPLVLVHLGLILIAVKDGLTAAEILDRTHGSVGWTVFYGFFVVAAALHAPIGLRKVLRENFRAKGKLVDNLLILFGLLLLTLGWRAVSGVTGMI